MVPKLPPISDVGTAAHFASIAETTAEGSRGSLPEVSYGDLEPFHDDTLETRGAG